MKIRYNVEPIPKRNDWKSMIFEFVNSDKKSIELDYEGDTKTPYIHRVAMMRAGKAISDNLLYMVRNDKLYCVKKEGA